MLRNRIEEVANYAPAPPNNGTQRTRNHGASYQFNHGLCAPLMPSVRLLVSEALNRARR
jgi:hypothetical protein